MNLKKILCFPYHVYNEPESPKLVIGWDYSDTVILLDIFFLCFFYISFDRDSFFTIFKTF